MTDLHLGAAAAGTLSGILAAYRRAANPGALDDMVESPTIYTPTSASVTLIFADGATFRLTCEGIAVGDSEGR